MSEFAAVLELLENASRSFGCATGTVRQFWDKNGVREAIRREVPGLAGSTGAASDHKPGAQEHVEEFWVQWPHRLRLGRRTPASPVPATRIVDGDEWWSYDPEDGAKSSLGNRRAYLYTGVLPYLLDPSTVAAALELEVAGHAKAAGRDAIRLLGTKRPTMRPISRLDPSVGANGASPYELLIDAERGILLRCTSFFDEAAVQISELTSVDFDAVIPETRFQLELPEGVKVRAWTQPEAPSCRVRN